MIMQMAVMNFYDAYENDDNHQYLYDGEAHENDDACNNDEWYCCY